MLGSNEVILLINTPVPLPSFVLLFVIVGFELVDQQTPFDVIVPPPSLLIFPPHVAYVNYWWGNDLGATSTLSPATQWFNAVAKFDGTTRSIWINGVQKASDAPSGHNVTTSALQVAKTTGSEYLNGNIGQALIYNRALSTAEIQQNYEATRTRYGV